MDGEKIVAKHISDQELASRVYKEPLQLGNKRQTTPRGNPKYVWKPLMGFQAERTVWPRQRVRMIQKENCPVEEKKSLLVNL